MGWCGGPEGRQTAPVESRSGWRFEREPQRREREESLSESVKEERVNMVGEWGTL